MASNHMDAKENMLLEELEKIRKSTREKYPPQNSDLTEKVLGMIQEEVKELEDKVRTYEENGNSTGTYQKLKWECSQLDRNLDNMHLRGRDKLHKERKSLLMRIEEAADTLEGKARGNVKPSDSFVADIIAQKPVFNIKCYESDKK